MSEVPPGAPAPEGEPASSPAAPWWVLAVVLGVSSVVRLPFWLEALQTPLDGDEAVIGLMSRALGHAPHIWGQPFGSPLEALLVAPFVSLLGPTVVAFRLPYFLLGLLLPLLAASLAARLHPRAALPAGLLLACPPPYALIVASLATIYPSALVLGALLLLLSLRLAPRLRAGGSCRLGLAAWGLLAGLALWTHLMSGAVVAAGAVYLWRQGSRRLATLVMPALVAVAVTAPWWVSQGPQALRIVRVSAPGKPAAAQWLEAPGNLASALGGLAGVRTPLIVDEPRWTSTAPFGLGWAAALAYLLALVWALHARRRDRAVWLLAGAAVLTLLAFAVPERSGPHTVRYLTPLLVPASVVVAAALAHAPGRVLVAVLAGLMGLNLAGARALHSAWHGRDRAKAPFLLPDLAPVLQALEARGLRRAFAAYMPAYRLTFASGERIVVTQPWNERFRHHPLPYLDEVRFAKDVAWILIPSVSSELPEPGEFEESLHALGARFERVTAGPAFIYFGFQPPFGSSAQSVPGGGAAGDGDVRTALQPARHATHTWSWHPARALTAVTLLAQPDGPRLPRGALLQVSQDGVRFHTVWHRERGREREVLAWVGGQPQYAVEHDAVTVPLSGAQASHLRLQAVDPREDWSVGEVLLHTDGRGESSFAEWLDARGPWDRRVERLLTDPRRERSDWHHRLGLALRAHAQRHGRSVSGT